MKKTCSEWTEADLDKLREYAANEASLYRTAAALRRTVAGIRTMARRQDILFKGQSRRSEADQAASP
jgi:hypothetical protein